MQGESEVADARKGLTVLFRRATLQRSDPQTLASQFGAILEEIEKKIVAARNRRALKRRRHADCVRHLVFFAVAAAGVLLALMYLYHPGLHRWSAAQSLTRHW